MARNSIKLIEEAEALALNNELNAQKEADEKIARAKEDAAAAKKEALEAAKKIVRQTRESYEDGGKAMLEEAAQKSREKCEQLKADAQSKLSAAVDMVIEDIIKN